MTVQWMEKPLERNEAREGDNNDTKQYGVMHHTSLSSLLTAC